jgi:hypothetical protein
MTLIKVSVTRGVTDSMALKHYMDMYKQPLNEESIEAIEKLTEVVADKKSKKDKKKYEEERERKHELYCCSSREEEGQEVSQVNPSWSWVEGSSSISLMPDVGPS